MALEQLARLLDQAFDPILVWELGGGIRSWNRGACQLYGFNAAEAMGRVSHELLHTEFPDGRDDCEAALRRDGRWEGELRHRTADGRWVTVESRMSLVRMADRHDHVLEVNRDVTTRKLAEEAIRHRLELQQQLAMIAASVPGSSTRSACGRTARPPCRSPCPPSRICTASPRACWRTTSPRCLRMCIPMTPRPLSESVERGLPAHAPWHSRFRYRHPVKGELDRGLVQCPGRARSERALAWIPDGRHRVEQSETARRESERLARSVLDSLSSHIAVLDESGTILAVNRSWRTFAEANGAVGQVNEGANYLHVCDSATGEEREIATAFAAGIREVLAGRRPSFELEYPCHSPSQRRWFIGRVSPFLEGGPRRVVVAHENITARKMAEEQLRDSERMLAPVADDGPRRELGDGSGRSLRSPAAAPCGGRTNASASSATSRARSPHQRSVPPGGAPGRSGAGHGRGGPGPPRERPLCDRASHRAPRWHRTRRREWAEIIADPTAARSG